MTGIGVRPSGPWCRRSYRRGACGPNRRSLPAVGWVHATDKGKGTGWVVDAKRRYLITNYHVVGENATAEVQFPVLHNGQPIIDGSS